MADQKRMPEVDFSDLTDKKLRQAYIYTKFLEEKNYIRAYTAKKIVRVSRFVAGICGIVAIGAYSYTINSVRQETFLDDWEEPEIPGTQ